jgi:CheY-like chemotaxis protein
MTRCLLVDDEPAVLSALKRLLALLGVQAHAVASGEEALVLLEHESFDLILLDLRMPGLSGIETWERIRARGGVVPPAVLVTAALEGESLANAHGMSFLAKPFDIDSLERLLARTRTHDDG